MTLYMVWQGRKAYGQAIADALRSGHAHLFYAEEQLSGASSAMQWRCWL